MPEQERESESEIRRVEREVGEERQESARESEIQCVEQEAEED